MRPRCRFPRCSRSPTVYAGLYLLAWFAVLALAVLLGAPGWLLVLLGILAAGISMLALDTVHPRVNLFAPAVTRVPPRAGAQAPIALTFDDGPAEPYTREILDVLDRYGAKASFFCIGENVSTAQELARAITERGHTLGNHTHSHRNLMFASKNEIAHELDRCQHSVLQATGTSPRFFRCPKGYKNPLLHAESRRR